MDIRNALAIIADLQARLLQAGFQAGEYGPRGDGIDGRYGDATRGAIQGLAASLGVQGLDGLYPTMAVLEALGYAKEDLLALQQAIDTWNLWRAANVRNPQYDAMATALLCEAVPELCAPAVPGPNGGVPANGNGGANGNGLVPAAPAKAGVSPWVWVAGALLLLGAVVAGVYLYQRRKKATRRSSTKMPALPAQAGPSYAGLDGGKASFTAGKEITPVEMGEGDEDEKDDDEGEGYGS